MEDKILYVSDLDGTLLRNDKTISPFSAKIIGEFIDRGGLFTYATARSYRTASEVSKGINPKIPIILYNGTFIAEPNGKIIYSNSFNQGEIKKVVDYLQKQEVYPLVYSFVDGKEYFSYREDKVTKGINAFNDDHPNDERKNPTTSEKLTQGKIFHITCIDEYEKLAPLYDEFKKHFQCVLYKDAYTKEWWLEIMPREATKANAIRIVSKMLGCNKIVCFGDGVNDMSMLDVANELYATENAHEELKNIATSVIESNENDGVAKFLLTTENLKRERRTK